ncbi:hypothetical protein L665_04453 [Ralstonia solanacearum SD54]|nr:hypothetical protein L665_04453 [Ralstonia solanacearum SD54]
MGSRWRGPCRRQRAPGEQSRQRWRVARMVVSCGGAGRHVYRVLLRRIIRILK